ncbi:DUF3077 domain-containing protein [Pseudomonas sp. HMWF021]|jgi:hypothetical protein|uniref:DUF3077 domain-containing protein n=1 Tax=Pseudomonas sp. HMWF021 TaxID=2056857 RepID=UPI000D3B9A36|nr:DUF3077 domain-containing protein [Pseudomonas sp. HMWF021]PTT26065.1 hypothetical protein DBR18_23270 [Pseudomonas sp. HMWF021]
MTETNSPADLKTIGLTPFIYCANQPLFHVSAGVPIGDALAQASDLLFLVKVFAEDAAYDKKTDRYAWGAHFLAAMSKAVIDDVVKVINHQRFTTRNKTQV